MTENQNVAPISLEEKKAKRLQFLYNLHELTGGSEFKVINMFDIGNSLGLDRRTTADIAQYLRQEGLLEFSTVGGGIQITHFGIREVEEAMSNPQQPTQYFPPAINVISVGQMTNSQIVQASPGATQELIISPDQREELLKEIESLKKVIEQYSIEQEQILEINAEIKTIEEQLKSPRPKRKIIYECGKSIRNVLEGALGSAMATKLLTRLPTLWSMIGGWL